MNQDLRDTSERDYTIAAIEIKVGQVQHDPKSSKVDHAMSKTTPQGRPRQTRMDIEGQKDV